MVQGIELGQVVRVLGLMLIPSVKAALLLDRKTTDLASVKCPNVEGVRRVVELRPVQPSLATMTGVIERHGVHVNPAFTWPSQFDPDGQPVSVVDVPEIVECLEARLQVIGIDCQIEIPVFPGLPSNKRIYAPTTADPVSDS
jgi:hypothetical protein